MIHLLVAAALAAALSFGALTSHGGHGPTVTTQDCTQTQCSDPYSGGGPPGG